MQTSIRFAGTCPTCGRHLHIPIDLYGKLVRCHGCNAEFRATGQRESGQSALEQRELGRRDLEPIGSALESHLSENGQATQRSSLDFKVDSLLAAADRQLHQAWMSTSTK